MNFTGTDRLDSAGRRFFPYAAGKSNGGKDLWEANESV